MNSVTELVNEASTPSEFAQACVLVRARIKHGLPVDMQHLAIRGHVITRAHDRRQQTGEITTAEFARVAALISRQVMDTYLTNPEKT